MDKASNLKQELSDKIKLEIYADRMMLKFLCVEHIGFDIEEEGNCFYIEFFIIHTENLEKEIEERLVHVLFQVIRDWPLSEISGGKGPRTKDSDAAVLLQLGGKHSLIAGVIYDVDIFKYIITKD